MSGHGPELQSSSSHPTADRPAERGTATRPSTVEVAHGGSFELRVQPVAKRVGDAVLEMLAYNGSIPGPTLRVQQGSEISVDVVNGTDIDTTVHWHGLRLDNRYDGVPHETQLPISPGGRYTHRLVFPDPGLYWYHPHVREDYAQELGLYGNVLVEPTDPTYWPAADREVVLTLDDLLVEEGRIAPFSPAGANYVAMGRYGNVLLVGGETEQHLEIERGQVLRLHLTNTANTRVFNVAVPGARMKLIGGDSGRYEREEWVEHVVVAPSERAIVDVRVDQPGDVVLLHRTPDDSHVLADLHVVDTGAGSRAHDFDRLRVNADLVAQRRRVEQHLDAPPDKVLALVAEMDVAQPQDPQATYVCPMHPAVVRDAPGHCPICGMKLLPADLVAAAAHEPMAAEPPGPAAGHHHEGATADGIEWEDLMADVNRTTTTANMRWKVVDRDTGAENGAIEWRFTVGDQVKIRLVNEMASDHPMHHPFHVHGERFLVLARDGTPEPNLVWKDTVLIRTGQTVDVLVDASNPGMWMAHCHIAEHLAARMAFTFRVDRAAA